MTNFERWIAGWIDIAHGIAAVLSLGHYYSGWDMMWASYTMKKKMNEKTKKQG